MEEEKKINWFPGHMAKAMRKTEEDAKLCDGVIYVLDARAPFACINEKLIKIVGNKPIIYALNKVDLAGKSSAEKVVREFLAQGRFIQPLCGTQKKDVEKLKTLCLSALSDKIERDRQKGVKRTLRFMVIGIPNTGKSTIINTLVGSKKAQTGDKAGVTRANKWVKVGGFDLLDTPGTMPPSMENQTYATHLAYIGSVNDDILDMEGLTLKLIQELKTVCPDKLAKRYNLQSVDKEAIELFDEICVGRGYLFKGGVSDYERCAKAIISDLRKGKIGEICFEVEP